MKNSFSWQNNIKIISVVISLLTVSCTPWYLNSSLLRKDYLAAVVDARTVESSKICHTLPTITTTGENPHLEWMNENDYTFILVGSMIAERDVEKWQEKNEFQSTYSHKWVTLPYDLANHVRNLPLCTDSLECRMRMLQLLGLPPESKYNRIVFFYAERSKLFRPSPDSEIDDCESSLDFPNNESEQHRKWFDENSSFSYNSNTPYPWTRLGYTYNWNKKAKNKIGPGEFIVLPDAKIWVKRNVTIWTWYQEITN